MKAQYKVKRINDGMIWEERPIEHEEMFADVRGAEEKALEICNSDEQIVEVRWNWEGSLQGHYFDPWNSRAIEFTPKLAEKPAEKIMTVKMLIDRLEAIEDKNQEVIIAIQQYNKNYPVAYTKIIPEDYLNQAWDEVRLMTSLPDNMRTMTMKGGK